MTHAERFSSATSGLDEGSKAALQAVTQYAEQQRLKRATEQQV